MGMMFDYSRARSPEMREVFGLVDRAMTYGAGLPVAKRANIYYVSLDGSATASGLGGWSNALSTIAAARALMNARIDWGDTPWGIGDIMLIAPGTYIENLTSMPYAGAMIGIGHDIRDAQFGVKIQPASGAPLAVSAMINTLVANIGFESPGTSKAFSALVCNNNWFINCRFSGAAESVTCTQAFYTNDAVANRWVDCEWTCAAVGFDCAYADGGDSFSHNRIIRGRINQCTTAGLRMSTNLVGPSSSVEGTILFGGGQTLAIGVDDNASILDLFDLRITATDPVQGCRSANACYGNGSLLNGSGE